MVADVEQSKLESWASLDELCAKRTPISCITKQSVQNPGRTGRVCITENAIC